MGGVGGKGGADMKVLRRIGCWCCNSILPRLPGPVELLCFSSPGISALVARWRGGGGLGGGGRGGRESG